MSNSHSKKDKISQDLEKLLKNIKKSTNKKSSRFVNLSTPPQGPRRKKSKYAKVTKGSKKKFAANKNHEHEQDDKQDDFVDFEYSEDCSNGIEEDREIPEATNIDIGNILSNLNKSLRGKSFFQRKRKTWFERVTAEEENWKKLRPSIISQLIKNQFIGSICVLCHSNDAVIYCSDCSGRHMCHDCDIKQHEMYPLHNRTGFVDGANIYLQPNESVLDGRIMNIERTPVLPPYQCQHCKSFSLEKRLSTDPIAIVTVTGRFNLNKFLSICVECGAAYDPFTIEFIIPSGFWPSVPESPSMLISRDVFVLWDLLRKHSPGTSLNSFMSSLNELTKQYGRSGKVEKNMFRMAFKEWCFVQHELNIRQSINWLECPSCTIDQHSCHVDGNCKLYRYRNSGLSKRESFYESCFIISDAERDLYLDSVYNSSSKRKKGVKDDICGGQWSAARNYARKKVSTDITGLQVASCRHQLAQKAVNMNRGELYAYSMFLIKRFLIPNGVRYIYADVMCKLFKFIEKFEPDLSKQFTGALSVMHAKGHSLECQIVWDGEMIKGSGRSTGEECEQLFSYLSRASNTTKYQRPENREETLTELVMFWNKRKIENLAQSLLSKFNSVSSDLRQLKEELDTLCKNNHINYRMINVDMLYEKIKLTATRGNFRSLPLLSATQSVILLYHTLKVNPFPLESLVKSRIESFSFPELSFVKIPLLNKRREEQEAILRNFSVAVQVEHLHNEYQDLCSNVLIPAMQIAIEELYYEKVHWNAKMKKYADSSKERHYFRQKMSKPAENLKKLVMSYVNFAGENCTSSPDQLLNGCFPWKKTTIDVMERINDCEKKLILEKMMKIQRCKEELCLIKTDMRSYVEFYRNKIQTISTNISHSEENSTPGVTSLLHVSLLYHEMQLAKGMKHFRRIIKTTDTNSDADDIVDDIEIPIEDTEENIEESEIESSDDELDNINFETILAEGKQLIKPWEGKHLFTTQSIGNVFVIDFPDELSQSSINGRNGSNACTVIALLTGGVMARKSGTAKLLGRVEDDLREMGSYFIGCIELGNVLHNYGDMLSVAHGIRLLPETFASRIVDEFNCTLLGNGEASSLKETISAIADQNVDFCVIVSDKMSTSMCCCYDGRNIFLFDSHANGDFGPCIYIVEAAYSEELFRRLYVNQGDQLFYVCSVSLI